MAIVQISQITNRKGLSEDLPQLAGAELGWSTDTRQLYIGNGTLEEGAPVIGNTEILTEFSDILNISSSYTYKGTAAGYIVQTAVPPSTVPTSLTLQQWMDQYASVKDFGAVGDGNTDDTEAINNALNQLYCQSIQSSGIRRSLFFPAGTYKVSNTINIPSYATLVGEGADNSIIQLVNGSGAVEYVAQTADSTQQIGPSIATAPTNITVANMAFSSLDSLANIFLVQCAQNCRFQNVSFIGPQTTGTIATVGNPSTSAGVIYGSTVSLPTKNNVFETCYYTGTMYGHYSTETVAGAIVNNSKFNVLYQGVVLSNVTGFRITNNIFDNVYYDGVIFGSGASLNATGYNIFYNVGNQFTSTAYSPIIDIQTNNNVSIGDMFSRDATSDISFPRVKINGTRTIATVNGTQLNLGSYITQSANIANIANNTSGTITVPVTETAAPGFTVNYVITGNSNTRIGQLMVAGNTILDTNVQTGNTAVTLTGNTNPIVINYTNAGNTTATMKYSISYFGL